MQDILRIAARLALAVLTAVPQQSLADSWPAAQVSEVFSKSRSYFVRVIPGKSIGDTHGFAGAAKGAYASAEIYRRHQDKSYRFVETLALLNPVAPVDVLVSDEGAMIALDNWHNRGYGKVVALYVTGKGLIRAYALDELFLGPEISTFKHSVSSIQWRSGPSFLNADGTLYISVGAGSGFSFSLASGSFAYCEWQAKEFRCRTKNAGREWMSNADARRALDPAAAHGQPAGSAAAIYRGENVTLPAIASNGLRADLETLLASRSLVSAARTREEPLDLDATIRYSPARPSATVAHGLGAICRDRIANWLANRARVIDAPTETLPLTATSQANALPHQEAIPWPFDPGLPSAPDALRSVCGGDPSRQSRRGHAAPGRALRSGEPSSPRRWLHPYRSHLGGHGGSRRRVDGTRKPGSVR